MLVLSKGYKLPQAGDFGTDWFPALEFDIQRLNDHTHDGLNSQQISSQDLVATTSSVLVGDFTLQVDGTYLATVNTPAGRAVANFNITLRDPSTKEAIYMKVVLNTLTSVNIISNTAVAVEVVFGL